MDNNGSWMDMLALNLGGGAVAGLAVGYAFKRLSKLVLLLVGICILVLYALMKGGYITVHWDAVNQGLADGSHSAARWMEGMLKELSLTMFGFSAGFVLGLKIR